MGKILILNGSPRAPKSNSKRYAEIFMRHCTAETDYRNITKKNHEELCAALSGYTDVLFAFPLYADSLPVGFLNFLKALEACPPAHKPVVSILINCGFLEAEQSEVAIRMMRLFCRRNGYVMGSVSGRYHTLSATMPLSKYLFRLAADIYWTFYGKRFGTTRRQMQTMEVEGK